MKKVILLIMLVLAFYNPVKGRSVSSALFSVVEGCEVELTVKNYKSIMEENNFVVVKNPFMDGCVPLSFNQYERKQDLKKYKKYIKSHSFKNVFIDVMSKKESREELNNSVIMYKNGYHFIQMMRYYYNKEQHKKFFYGMDYVTSKEFFFIHEIFHLTKRNLESDLPQQEKEFLADIGAIMLYSKKYGYENEEMYQLAHNIFKLRRAKAKQSGARRTHLKQSMWLNFLNKIENKEVDLNNLVSFKDFYKESKRYLGV